MNGLSILHSLKQDYYPFGMVMPLRQFGSGGGYRYGFNGKEEDDEVKWNGNQQDYGMRIYDTRLGRFLSVDPLTEEYPWYSPYQFAGNMPIKFIDLDGAEAYDPTGLGYGMADALTRLDMSKKGKSDEEIRKYVNSIYTASATGTFLGTALALDLMTGANVVRTGGSLLLVWQASQVYEFTNRNSKQPDPKIRAENEAKAKEALSNLVISFGVGVISERFVKGAVVFFKGPQREEVGYFFRGTSNGFEGSPQNQRIGVTPTSTDPVVATIFAVHSKQYSSNAILQIALPSNLQGINYSGNVLETLEREVGLFIKPVEFTQRVSVTITADQAVGILQNIGVKLPKIIKETDISEIIRNTPRLTPSQTRKFYEEAVKIANK